MCLCTPGRLLTHVQDWETLWRHGAGTKGALGGAEAAVDQVEAIVIERAYYTGGGPNADHDRTVIIKFASFKARDAVLQAARANRPRGVFVSEDFSMRVVSRRKELLPEMRHEIEYLSFDELIIKDRQERHQRWTNTSWHCQTTLSKPLFDSSEYCSTWEYYLYSHSSRLYVGW